MEETEDNDNEGPGHTSESRKEIVWSVGDRCRARWSGDGKLYTGVVTKLRRVQTDRVVAVVRFADYDDEDCEEVNIQQLQRVARGDDSDGKKEDRKRAEDRSEDRGEGSGAFFRPLTGSEDVSRLEDKYGHESDSDSGEQSDSNNWISPTPYRAKGKVSEWRVRSPAKSTASVSPRHKVPVVNVPSPRKKKNSAGRKGNGQSEKKEKSTIASDSAYATSAGESSPFRSPGEEDGRKDGAKRRCARPDEGDDSAFCRTSDEGLFGGFDEDDMEKPKFTFPAPSEKVPFCLDESQNIQIPAPLNQYLRDYQREGVQFLYSHYKHNRGAVLGDDMGLGKTVQVIAFLSALMRKQANGKDVLRQKPRFIRMMSDTPEVGEEGRGRGPVLIIGPGSVLYNWLEELETWGYFTARKYHGSDKASCLADVGRGKVEVVVTTFETCRDNVDALNKVEWDAIIVDEVHRIKGLKAQTTKALRTLQCVRRYGLTGTALQNNMSELWCILDWAQPNVAGRAEDFEEDFVRPIELGQKQNATKRELAVARKKKEEFAKVRSEMMVRRTKKLIADQLPTKTDRVVFCRLAPLQVSVYQAVLGHPDLRGVLGLKDRCDCGSGRKPDRCCLQKPKSGKSSKSVLFTFMHVLLKASNHIALLIPHGKMGVEQARQARSLCDIAFRDHPQFMELARDAAFRTLSDPKYCGKMKVLHGMLSVFAKEHSKVLVFSYSTRLLDILEQHIMSEGLDYRRIDGSVSGRRRQEIVREFNANPDIFLCLVSTKAGGLGLNMTGANKVVIFDPNWNPSHDLQAQDRAYRIGQRRNVEVYRLISAGSIEENIYLRQIYKQQLDNVAIGTENARRYFQGIQGDAKNQGELFGIRNMFQLRTGDSCLTMDILSRNAKVEAGVAGQEVADYIPSWRERHNDDDDSTEEEEEWEEGGRGEESSDEETLQAFKDLFDAESDEDEKEKLPPTRKTPTKTNADPKPSTSGLRVPRRALPAAHSTELLHNDSDSESERRVPFSKPTTRQRQSLKKKASSSGSSGGSLFDETSASEVLSFLEEGDERAAKKGKAPKKRQARGVESDGALSGRKKSKTPQGPAVSSEKDSMVTPSFSSVSSVFERYGVVHVHDNPRVVGGSRVEDHMTRCAMHDVFQLRTNTQDPALLCDPMSQPTEEEEEKPHTPASGRRGQRGRGTRGRTPSKDHNSARTMDHGRWHIMIGQTPSAIRKKQWTQLKQMEKDQDEVTLAQTVLRASPEERLGLLKAMYKGRHDRDLHDTLDAILTKPEDQCQHTAAETRQHGNRARKTQTARRQTAAGQKKRSQPKSAARKKATARGGKRKGPGLLYDDLEDTEMSPVQQTSTTTALEEDPPGDDSQFTIGASVSPARVKAIRNRRRAGRSRQTQRGGVSASLFDRSEDEEPMSDGRVMWKIADKVKSKNVELGNRSVETEDVEGLLHELGRNPGGEECDHRRNQDLPHGLAPSKHRTGVDANKKSDREKSQLSVLDDLFSDPEDTDQKKRKPPPPNRGRKQTHTPDRSRQTGVSGHVFTTASTSDFGDLPGPQRVSDRRKPRSATSSSEIFSELMNNSTLRDDDVDCFGEPSQWKKRHRPSKTPVKSVDRMLQKSNDDYFHLFETGRMVKKKPQKEKEEKDAGYTDIVGVWDGKERKESSDLDPSGSLFG